MKCNYCKEEKGLKTLGVSGAYSKEWVYCPDHYMRAKVERDNFLVKKDHRIYDRVPSHNDYFEEHCSQNVPT